MSTVVAAPAPRVPTVDSTPAASRTRCRPTWSAAGPLPSAPSIAPNTVALTTAPCCPGVSVLTGSLVYHAADTHNI